MFDGFMDDVRCSGCSRKNIGTFEDKKVKDLKGHSRFIMVHRMATNGVGSLRIISRCIMDRVGVRGVKIYGSNFFSKIS